MVLEKLMQEPVENRTVDRAKKLARELWPKMENHPDYQGLELDDRGGLDFRINGWRAIEGLWDLEDPSEVRVASTEQDVRVEINGVPFRGIIDRVDETDEGLVVTDYKSGKAPSQRYSSNYSTQMLLYAAALTELEGQKPAKAQLLYLGQKVVEVGDHRREPYRGYRRAADHLAGHHGELHLFGVRRLHRPAVRLVPVRGPVP